MYYNMKYGYGERLSGIGCLYYSVYPLTKMLTSKIITQLIISNNKIEYICNSRSYVNIFISRYYFFLSVQNIICIIHIPIFICFLYKYKYGGLKK